jgi:outer membrane receptor protein involved in Fe transport
MKKTLLCAVGSAALLTPVGAVAQVDEIVVTATKREQTLQEVPVAVSVVQEETIERAQIIDIFDLQSVVPSLEVTQNQSSQNTTFSIRGFGNGGNNVGIEPSVGVFIDGVYRSRSASAISDLIEIERVEVLRGPQSTLFGKNASAGVVSVVTREPQFDFAGQVEATIGNYDSRIIRGYVTGPVSDTLALSLSATSNQRDGFVENLSGGPDLNDRDRYAFRGQALFEPLDELSFRVIADYDKLEEVCCFAGNALAGPTVPIIRALGGNVVANDIFAREAFTDVAPVNDIENMGVSLQADWDLGFGEVTSITSYRRRDSEENIDADFTSLAAISANPQIVNFNTFTQELRISGETDRFGWLAGAFYLEEETQADSYISYGPAFRPYGTLLALSGAGVQLTPGIIGAVAQGSDLGGLNPITGLEDALGFDRGTFFAPGQTFGTLYDQDNQSLSLFAQGDFDVTDRLTITAGVAWNKDEKQVTLDSFNQDVFSSLNLVEIGFGGAFQQAATAAVGAGLLNPAALAGGITPDALAAYGAAAAASGGALPSIADLQAAAADPAQNPALGLQALQFLPPQTDFPNAVEDGETDDDQFTYTLRAAYDVSDRINVYGSWATGFKASSFNLTRDGRPLPGDVAALAQAGLLPNSTGVALGTYQGTRFAGPEETEVFELGAKARFDWGSVNLALFDQTIEGFQSTIFQGTGFVLANAGEQSARGIEAEFVVQPTDWIDFRYALLYLDAEFDSFENAPVVTGSDVDLEDGVADGVGDVSGDTVVGTPEFSSSTVLTLFKDLSVGQAFVRGEWHHESEQETTALNIPVGVAEGGFDQFNASLGINFDNGFEALLWGRNIFDEEYAIVAFPSVAQAGSFSAYPNPPRTYGVTVRKRF